MCVCVCVGGDATQPQPRNQGTVALRLLQEESARQMILMRFSTQPRAVIIGYSVLRRFQPLLILQGLMFMKITFRDRAVVPRPIHPYLITKIYSSLSRLPAGDVEGTSRCSRSPHRAALAAENQL